MKRALVAVEIFVFCGWWFSNQIDIMSKTHFSLIQCQKRILAAIQLVVSCGEKLNSLLFPETDWKVCIGKQGYVVLTFHS